MAQQFEHLPGNIRRLREALCLSQAQLARLIGVDSAKRVSEFEAATRCPHIVVLRRIADVFQMTPEQLLEPPPDAAPGETERAS